MKFGLFRSKRKHCPHSNLRGIYGDEINQHGFRLECVTCGRLLDGPVSLANKRSEEIS